MFMLNNAALITPARLVWPGSWVGHIPFSSWLVDALKPRVLVELGTHTGNSYNGFCQAAVAQSIELRAFAVDTWIGDKHAGKYDNNVFLNLKEYHEPLYGQFSTLLRMTFDEALSRFDNGTVDLLHIDGLHTYEAVRHDFESWLPKLSNCGIVLFHDTEVYREDFGVHKLWSELSLRYPNFNFKHSNGLGVLLVGSNIPNKIQELAEKNVSSGAWPLASKLFQMLGARLERQSQIDEMQQIIAGRDVELDSARKVIAHIDGDLQELRSEVERRGARIEEVEAFQQHMAADRLAETNELQMALSDARMHIETRENDFLELNAKYLNLISQIDATSAQKFVISEEENININTGEMKDPDVIDARDALIALILSTNANSPVTAPCNIQNDLALQSEVNRLSREIHLLHCSVSWRMTSPMRWVLSRTPRLRLMLRRTAKFMKWIFTGQVRFQLNARRQQEYLIQPIEIVASVKADVANSNPVEVARDFLYDASLAIPLGWSVPATSTKTRIAAIVHLFYEELAQEFRSYLECIGENVDVYISTCNDFKANLIRAHFEGWKKGTVEVRLVENRGRDVAPKLLAFKDVYDRYEYILYLHGKRSHHATVLAPWRQFMLESLVGNGQSACSILSIMDSQPQVGMVGVQHFEPLRHWLNWGGNLEKSQALAKRMGFSIDPVAPLDFPSGSMFWARSKALSPLLTLGLQIDEFDAEGGQKDATLAHAIERLMFFVCESAGFTWLKIARPEYYENTPRIESAATPQALSSWVKRNNFRLLDSKNEKPRSQMPLPISKPTSDLVRDLQQRALGLALKSNHEGCAVVVGIVTYNNPISEVRRAVEAAHVSLSMHGGKGVVYMLDNGSPTDLDFSQDDFVRSVPTGGNCGFGAAHNRLMSLAFDDGATHYVAVNPDGLLHPEAITALMDMMSASADTALVEALQFPREHPKPYDPYSFDTPWVSGGCLAISKQAYEALGGFDEGFFMYCEDVDLSWRARAAGFMLKTCPRALFLHAVTNRKANRATLAMIYQSGLRLARKWNAPRAFDAWVLEEMQALQLPIPADTPELVPLEWRGFANFEHHFVFAPPRWTSDD